MATPVAGADFVEDTEWAQAKGVGFCKTMGEGYL